MSEVSQAEVLLARSFRLTVIQQQYDCGNLTVEQARELLSGELTPGDAATVGDDSEQLVVKRVQVCPRCGGEQGGAARRCGKCGYCLVCG